MPATMFPLELYLGHTDEFEPVAGTVEQLPYDPCSIDWAPRPDVMDC